uniref:Transposase n=1 Tax=Magnetospirillum gryphiswaldense TaxID=55518 RepID=A4U1T2_9PROT|nr:transposase [Magnetospirillum gryphiswaldense MSR-1]
MPSPQFAHRRRRGRALVAAICEDALDERKQAADLLQYRQCAVAVLDIGGLDVGRQDHAERVDDDVALLAFDLLARVVTRRIDPRPPFSALLTLWLSMIAAVGLASFPAISRTSTKSAWWMRARVPSHFPQPEILMHGAPGRQVLGKCPPLATGHQHIKHPVQHFAGRSPSAGDRPVSPEESGGSPTAHSSSVRSLG